MHPFFLMLALAQAPDNFAEQIVRVKRVYVDRLTGGEGIDQLVRELVDEADRIRDDRRLTLAEPDLPARGVERGEEPVLRPRDLAPDERVEE